MRANVCTHARTHTQINQSLTAPNPINPRPTLRISLQKRIYCSELLNRHFSTSFWEWERKTCEHWHEGSSVPLGNSQVHPRAPRCTCGPTGVRPGPQVQSTCSRSFHSKWPSFLTLREWDLKYKVVFRNYSGKQRLCKAGGTSKTQWKRLNDEPSLTLGNLRLTWKLVPSAVV